MPRFSQWGQPSQVEEPKRPRLHGGAPPAGGFDAGALGLDLTQPPDSPELAVDAPPAVPPDISHELSQRVALGTGALSALPTYDEIHARLQRLDRLDDASVGKALSKAEVLLLLTANGINSHRASAHKATIVDELLRALKQRRIGATLADAQRALVRATSSVDDDDATLPPDELDAAMTDALAQMGQPQHASPRPPPPLPSATGAPAFRAAATPLLPVRTNSMPDVAALAQPHASAAKRRRGALPPASLTEEEEDFVYRLVTGTLGSIGGDGSDGAASRSVQTQTEPHAFAAPRSAGGALAPYSQLQQSQACVTVAVDSQQQQLQMALHSNAAGQHIDDLVGKCRKLLKAHPFALADDDIRSALATNGRNVMQAVESLRAKASTASASARAAAATSGPLGSAASRMQRVWDERVTRGLL
ncbi:hypothetical protein KFE25_007863 [Diacronema lutheri]|uniref:Uncharacterized protein n=2 Tax=Diacronema lutheri TaxID=2081491 RepID=A0A8J5Y115_DIALT|nr:hypothetical protein KFE25_007863 [Diacronema lutheri]